MILKIIFNLNFVNLQGRGGKGQLDRKMHIEDSRQGVSQEMKATHGDGNGEAQEDDEPR
jgi:hypothetical protein